MNVFRISRSALILVMAVLGLRASAAEDCCKSQETNLVCCEDAHALRLKLAGLPQEELVKEWTMLAPQVQQALWLDKLQQVIELPWSSEEVEYLKGLSPILSNNELFTASTNPEENKYLQEIGNYLSNGKEKFAWSSDVEYYLFGTLSDYPADKLPVK